MKTGFYTRLNTDQVVTVYGLFNFLKRLRVIGQLDAHTVQCSQLPVQIFGRFDPVDIIDMTGADYAIVKDGYSADKSKINIEEMLESIFGRRHKNHYNTY